MNDLFEPAPKAAFRRLPPCRTSNALILTGFMATGKSSVGRICAQRLGRPFLDTDEMIEAAAGMSIPEIFRTRGETEFRALEHSAVLNACSRSEAVIATGGGVPLDPANAELLSRSGVVVHLSASPRAILDRAGPVSGRPLLDGYPDPVARIQEMLRSREAAYTFVSDLTIGTDNLTPPAVADEVIRLTSPFLKPSPSIMPDAFRLNVDLKRRSYPIWMAAGMVGSGAGRILAGYADHACVVTHPALLEAYALPLDSELRRCGVRCAVVTIPAGERGKNLGTVERLYGAFAAAKIDRKGLIIAVGGGVAGDISGFAAATYLRGVRFAQVPTTLLAQVDSSIGGKTGVDLPAGKNLVGSFHQPCAVIIDPRTLTTLPLKELRSGLAEVIKYGIICDDTFFYQMQRDTPAILRRDLAALARAITRSCEIKASVVCADETEQGLRAILNFGHTVGHALESATQYRRYRHGEAIALGMVAACLVGEEIGVTPADVTLEVRSCLAAAKLPVDFPPDIAFEAILPAMLADKKTQSGKLRFVLAERIGCVRLVENVPPGAVRKAIERQKPQ